jgi:hypothetical protein
MHEILLRCRLLQADEIPFDFLDKKRLLKNGQG